MPITSPNLTFRSSKFAIQDGEDEATNPGIFGASLAAWIGGELVPEFSPDDIVAEDFGWLVPAPHDEHKLFVACASTDESAEEWRVFVFAEGGVLSRLRGKGKHAESVAALYEKLKRSIESEDGISDVSEDLE